MVAGPNITFLINIQKSCKDDDHDIARVAVAELQAPGKQRGIDIAGIKRIL